MSAVPEREHAHTYGLSCPADGCRWPSLVPGGIVRQPETSGSYRPLMPGGESTSAQLRRVRQELADGNRFTAGVVDEVSRLEQERDRANELTDKIAAELRLVTRERDSLARRLALRFAELVSARAELTRLRADLKDERATLAVVVADYADAADELQRIIPTSKETTMPATNDDGPILVASRSIFRQVIPVNDQWHTLHLRGPIVHVATRHEDCVEIWFIEDPTAGDEPRTLRVYGTGHAIDEPTAVHVGSAVTPSGQFVWHVLELPDRGAR